MHVEDPLRRQISTQLEIRTRLLGAYLHAGAVLADELTGKVTERSIRL
jgi:hypothetical protein